MGNNVKVDVLKRNKEIFERLIKKPLNSEKEVYDNICQLNRILEYGHDHIPNAQHRVYERLYYIQQTWGKRVLDKGFKIYEMHATYVSGYASMTFYDRNRVEEEIINDPLLAAQLDDMRYNPEKEMKGEYVKYYTVYCKMTEMEMEKREDEAIEQEQNQQQSISQSNKLSLEQKVAKFLRKNNIFTNLSFVDKFIRKQLNILPPSIQEERTTNVQKVKESFINELSNYGQYRNVPPVKEMPVQTENQEKQGQNLNSAGGGRG